MKNTVDILKFLFQDSQEQGELESYLKEVADAEKPGDAELKTMKSPLEAALKKAGVDMAEFDLEEAPEEGGFRLSTHQAWTFKDAVEKLQSPDGMHGLAELGWLATIGGDKEPTDADGYFEIYLVSVTGDEEPSDTEELSDLQKLIKNSYEFVNDPLPDREDIKASSPEIATDANQKGKEKATDGDQPKGTPKGMTKKSESLEQSRRKRQESLEKAYEILGPMETVQNSHGSSVEGSALGYQPNKLKPDEIHPGVKYPRWMKKGQDQSRAVDREIGRRIEQAKVAKSAKHPKAS